MTPNSELDQLIAAALSPPPREPDEAFIWRVRMAMKARKTILEATRAAHRRLVGQAAAALVLIVSAALIINTGAAAGALSKLGNPGADVATIAFIAFWLTLSIPAVEEETV